jgi:branched-chain amino acid transport system substrate-binding protein
MRKGRFLLGLAVLVCVSLFFGIHGAAAETVLKVGIDGPFTGPSAQSGQEFIGSVKMAMEKINYKIGDYKLEIVWIDDQSDPAKATSAYAEAVERGGIQAASMNWNSSVAVALMDVAAQYKIPHFFGFGATEVVNEKWRANPQKYSYWGGKGWPIPAKLMKGYAECINNAIQKGIFKPANKLMAVYGEDTDWGRSAGGALKEEFTKSGWKLLSEDYFPITQTDFYQLLSKYKNAGVAVIAGTSSSAPVMSAFIKQSQEVGLKAMIVADGLGWIGDWYKLTGPASDYVLDMIPQLTTQKAKDWAKTYESRFNMKPSPSAAGLCYDGTNMFIKLLTRTLAKYGKLERETIHRTMVEEINTGKLTYSEKDGAIIMKEYRYTEQTMPDPVVARDGYYFPVIQYKGGQGDIVYPADWAVRSFQAK